MSATRPERTCDVVLLRGVGILSTRQTADGSEFGVCLDLGQGVVEVLAVAAEGAGGRDDFGAAGGVGAGAFGRVEEVFAGERVGFGVVAGREGGGELSAHGERLGGSVRNWVSRRGMQ